MLNPLPRDASSQSPIRGRISTLEDNEITITATVSGVALAQRPVSLRRNLAWTLAGNVIYAGCQWGCLVALSRVGNTEMVGQFALGLAIANPVFLLSQLQLRSLQATDASHSEYRPGDYLALRLLMTLLALAVTAVVTIAAGYRHETARVILFVAVAKACDSVTDVFYGHLQQYEDLPRIARSMMMRGILSVSALTAAVWVTHSAAMGALGWACAWAVVLGVYDARPRTHPVRLVWDWAAMRRLAVTAFPLGVVMMLLSLDTNIPRYIIAHDLGEGSLGLFAAVASLQAAGVVLVSAMGQTSSPRLARYYFLRDDRSFRSLFRKFLALAALPGIVLVCVAWVAGDAVPGMIFGPAFSHQGTVFKWLSFSMALWLVVSVLGYTATATRRIRFQPYALGLVAITTWAMCAFAVPRYGIVGGAIASATSAMVGCVLFTVGLLVPRRDSVRADI
jgi:O-antigen/teichoic acid export membrane protein